MWVRQFTRDREIEAEAALTRPRRGRGKALQSENRVIVLNEIHEENTHIEHDKLASKNALLYMMKFCLKGLKHTYTKDEWMKVMNNDIVT